MMKGFFRGSWRGVALSICLVACVACATSNNRPLQLVAGAGPVYPDEARQQQIEGDVVVQYDVNVDGMVTNARIVSAIPPGVFEEAALTAVRSWRFNAPVENGVKKPALNRRSTVAFRLGGTSEYDNY